MKSIKTLLEFADLTYTGIRTELTGIFSVAGTISISPEEGNLDRDRSFGASVENAGENFYMVLQKRLDYGFNGYQVPPTPRASRSARGKRSSAKKVGDNQMCAFDLLASVAGKLLLEKENSPVPRNVTSQLSIEKDTIKQEPHNEGASFTLERCDQSLCSNGTLHRQAENCALKECCHAQDDLTLGPTCSVAKFDKSENLACAEESLIDKQIRFDKFSGTVCGKCHVERGSCGCVESLDCIIENETARKLNSKHQRIGTAPDLFNVDDPIEMDAKPPTLVSSDSSIEVPSCGDYIPSGSPPRHQDASRVVSRDDDENSSGCTQPSLISSNSSRSSHLGDWRIRKLWASKCWKVAPTMFKDGEISNPATSDEGISGEGTSSPVKAIKGEPNCSVKLRIKSFRVPDLFIEIPETATVGSLKRMVMEAVTAILGGGLRVGVVLQGKKVRDDSKTLLQTGISHDDKLDGLGFTLEPNTAHVPIPQDSHRCDATQPLTRSPMVPNSDQVVLDVPPAKQPLNLPKCVENNHNRVLSSTDLSLEKTTPDSKALVAHPTMNVGALAVVPLHRKSKQSELVQRRIRRPFSVTEVEALVQAVEKLGTGRWRDVKLRAFENAKHRTYVDLKRGVSLLEGVGMSVALGRLRFMCLFPGAEGAIFSTREILSKNFTSAKKRRAGSAGALRPGPLGPCLLVAASSKTSSETEAGRPFFPLIQAGSMERLRPLTVEIIPFFRCSMCYHMPGMLPWVQTSSLEPGVGRPM
ncbi:hypothetical protein ACLOJK_029996 [Asimina triloba]